MVLTKSTVLDFEILLISILTECFVLLAEDPMHAMRVTVSRRYSSFKSLLNYSKLLPIFLCSGPHTSTVCNFEILTFRFLTKF